MFNEKNALLIIMALLGFSVLGYLVGTAPTATTEQVYIVDRATYKENAALAAQIQELEAEVDKLQAALDETRVVHATLTAYSPDQNQTDGDPFVTASMEKVKEGCVAVSRDLFYKGWVFGRRIYIEGKGIFVINDLMHSRKTNQIDIFRFSTTKAEAFGIQHARVVLLN